MNKLFFALAGFFLCFFASCEKEQDVTPDNVPSPFSQTGFFGYIYISDFVAHYYNDSVYNTEVNAEFNNVIYDISVPHISSKDAGLVSINGVQLKRNAVSFAFNYQDTSNALISSPFILNASGGSAIPAFSLAINNPYPSFGNFNQMGDTIYKSQGFNFLVSGITDADSLFVIIDHIPGYKRFGVNGQSNINVNYTSSEIAALNVGVFNHVTFHFTKYDTVFQAPKFYHFTLLKGFTKDSYIKN